MKRGWILTLLVLGAADARADEAMAKKHACTECHRGDKKGVGPAYKDIAAKYKTAPGARERLTAVVKQGGKGNWPDSRGVPMPPYGLRLSDAEIGRLVDWILSH